jgi:hypothetical protein
MGRERLLKARLTTLLVAATAIAAVVVGCGDSDESTSATGSGDDGSLTTSSLDKEEFVEEAGAACGRVRKGLVSEVNAYLSQHQKDGLAETALLAKMAKAVLLPTVEAEIAAIRKLGAPEGDEDEVEALLVAQQAAVDKAKELQKVSSIEDVEAQFTDATKMFKDYGFKSFIGCLNSP